MDFLNWVQASPNQFFVFLIHKLGVFYPFKPKVANVLFLGKDENCKKAVISSLSDDESQSTLGKSNITSSVMPSEYLTSWVSTFGKIKFNFFDLGEHWIAHRVWRDYGAKMDAVVYIVNADIMDTEQFLGPREELNALLSDEAFANVPFVIFVVTANGAFSLPKERLYSFLGLLDVTTGTRKVEPADENAHPLKVFVAEAKECLDVVKWLSQYIKQQ
ncbi:hypothetical protein RGQ29_013893 [Quercus rubra]|uniref:Uncharacterized protein n=1 Tax=Quercus rubra TaxID=3512 RepID=A0AAN7FQ92_QUERU|nr:hypothetical protein RGQ29_013893 [Quercus rubra]